MTSDGTDVAWATPAADAVTSVFGRVGVVAAAASDYDASQIDNDSGVTGAFVDDALNTLDTDKLAAADEALPIGSDRFIVSAVATVSGDALGWAITDTPVAPTALSVKLNGIEGPWSEVSDGPAKDKGVYFSLDGGITALAIAAIVGGATAHLAAAGIAVSAIDCWTADYDAR